MKLAVHKRTGTKKSEITRIRYEGDIPGVLYGPRRKSETIFIKGPEFQTILRTIEKGKLSTTVFDLQVDKEEHKALVKEVQYHKTTYNIIHIDFELLSQDVEVVVKVPISFIHAVDCVGVKLGGFLRKVIRYVKISCLPKHIPESFTLDVKNLNIGDSLKISDIDFPKEVRTISSLKEVAVVVAKR